MAHVIVLSGPDGTGKTEIGKALAEKLSIPYFKFSGEARCWTGEDGYSFVDALRYDQTYISEFLEQTHCQCIIDRAWPCEYAYSQAYSRKTDMRILRAVDDKMASIGTIVIVLSKMSYANSRPDPLVENDMLPKIHKHYDDFIQWTSCDVVNLYVKGEEWRDSEVASLKNAIEFMNQHPVGEKVVVKFVL